MARGRPLTIELTERQTIPVADGFLDLPGELRAVGVALDDFGVDYSSYSYLRRLRPDSVKIDGSFVGSLLADPHDQRRPCP